MTNRKLAAIAATIAVALPVVAAWEGLRTRPYYDIVGVRTVCYGETRGVQERIYTRAECDEMLSRGLHEFYRQIDPCMPDDVPPRAAGMFLSLAYNIGPRAFCQSRTIQTAFANKDYAAACRGILLFNRAGGRVVQGLVNRRTQESQLCLAGLQ